MADSTSIYSRNPTFHNTDAAYILPNDATEHARLVTQHKAFLALAKGRLIHAPVSSPSVILDVGCGTGVVTRYLSSHFSAAHHVYGIDLSPVPSQSEDKNLSNLSFIQGDFRKLAGSHPYLAFESVDFLYSRLLLCGMTDWPGYVRDAFRMLKAGGWAEMDDYVEDFFYKDNRIVPREQWEWLQAVRAGGIRQGLDLDAGLHIRQLMEDAGFVDIQTFEYRIPYWKEAQKERPETAEIIELSIGDKWGLYWHMIPKLLKDVDYNEDDIERLRMDMLRNVGEEEGKEQLFCVTIGRKPSP